MTHPAGYPSDPAGFLEQPTANGNHEHGGPHNGGPHNGGPHNGGPHNGDPHNGDTENRQAVERRRRAELTPAERVQQKRNRRLLLAIAIPALLLGILALIASILADAGTPGPRPRFVPAGYHGVTDGVFSYSVPNSWSKNDAYSDDAGDLENSGAGGWVGDHLTARPGAPAPGEAPPPVFESFGVGRPTPFSAGPATRIQVAGTTVAYRYTIARPGGFTATAIDAWQSSSGAELWLMVNANPQITTEIISTLNG